jgi:predicted MPP superfamily phosphohydrolase
MARRRLVSFSPVALVIGIVAAASFSGAGQTNEPSKASASANTVRFVAIGDMGTGEEDQDAVARRMVAQHDEHPYDTVLTLGDNIYPDGHAAHLALKFERPYAELLKRGVNFYAALGNHDVKKGRKAQINYKPFHMGGRSYYSFTKGTDDRNQVQFFAIDSTAFDGAQQRWLESALAGSRARWKLAYFHHPIYSSARGHGSAMKLRARLEPLLVRYGVAAVFSGHDHTYERTRPQQGVQYFVCGIGAEVRVGDLDRNSSLMAFGNDEDIGFMFVEVTADRLTFQAINAAGHVFDNGTIQPRVPALTTTPSE